MSRSVARVSVLVVLVSVLAVNVMAQSKIDDPFQFSIVLSAETTDNRDSSAIKQSNVDYYIGPKFELKTKPGEASKLTLSYNPTYRHRTEPSLTQNDSELYHRANIDFRQKSSEIKETRVIDQFQYTDDPSVTQRGTLLRRDSSYIYNRLEIGVNQKVQSANSLDIFGVYSVKAYDQADVAEESDENNFALHAIYLKQHQRKSAIAFEFEVGGTGYEKISGVDRSFMTVLGGVGIEHIATPSLRMGARVGGQYVDYQDSSLGAEVSPTFNFSIVGSTIPTVNFTGNLDHRVRGSDVFPFASQESTDLHGRVDWALTEQNIVLNGGLTYHVGTYSQDALPGGLTVSGDSDETAVILEGGIRYKYKSTTEFAVQLRAEDVSSDDALTTGREFTRNSGTFSVARQF